MSPRRPVERAACAIVEGELRPCPTLLAQVAAFDETLRFVEIARVEKDGLKTVGLSLHAPDNGRRLLLNFCPFCGGRIEQR